MITSAGPKVTAMGVPRGRCQERSIWVGKKRLVQESCRRDPNDHVGLRDALFGLGALVEAQTELLSSGEGIAGNGACAGAERESYKSGEDRSVRQLRSMVAVGNGGRPNPRGGQRCVA